MAVRSPKVSARKSPVPRPNPHAEEAPVPPHPVHARHVQLEKPATFVCTFRKVKVTSAKVAVNLRTGDLLSNGAYGQLIAGK
jgi:hypothetical protein